MKLVIYPENFKINSNEEEFECKVILSEDDIKRNMEELDVYDIVKIALILGKETYSNEYIEGFITTLSLKTLPSLKKKIKEQNADKRGIDACNVLLRILKNREVE